MTHSYGWVPDFKDRRDEAFKYVPMAKKLEPVDLRPGQPAIYNQLDLGSCTGQAVGRALQYVRRQQGQTDFFLSALMMYYEGRKAFGTIPVDSGAMIRDVVKAANKVGVCPEHMWPYDVKKFAKKPPKEAYIEASKYRALSYHAVDPNNVEHMHSALVEDCPVVFGIMLYSSFESDKVMETGLVPMPKNNERPLGGHAITAVGYEKKHFICANSWGEEWGDDGYFYLPQEYVSDPYLSMDFWMIRLASPQMPEDVVGVDHETD